MYPSHLIYLIRVGYDFFMTVGAVEAFGATLCAADVATLAKNTYVIWYIYVDSTTAAAGCFFLHFVYEPNNSWHLIPSRL